MTPVDFGLMMLSNNGADADFVSLTGMHSIMEAAGTKQEGDALQGAGLLQSPQEWDARNNELTTTLSGLIAEYGSFKTRRALDVGCQEGSLTDLYGRALPGSLQWFGIDPDIEGNVVSANGARLSKGFAHDLKFPDGYFDAIVFANVYEHLPPQYRRPALVDMYRVLAPGGILVGQIPNPYFPIESHSRLPFFGYFPRSVQRWYWHLTPTGWDFDKGHFFSVTMRHLRRDAASAGFTALVSRNFNYSPAAIPASVRWIAAIHNRLGMMPWAWQFVFHKPA